MMYLQVEPPRSFPRGWKRVRLFRFGWGLSEVSVDSIRSAIKCGEDLRSVILPIEGCPDMMIINVSRQEGEGLDCLLETFGKSSGDGREGCIGVTGQQINDDECV